MNIGNSDKKKNVCLVLIINLVLSILFYRSHYWIEDTTFNIKLRTYIVVFILMIGIPFVCFLSKRINLWLFNIRNKSIVLWKTLKDKKKRIGSLLLHYLVVIIVSFIVGIILGKCLDVFVGDIIRSKIPTYENNIILPITISCGCTVLYTIWKYRKAAYEKIHLLVLALILLVGTFFCAIIPCEVGISWDDHIHYKNAVGLIDWFSGTSYYADDILISRVVYASQDHYGYSYEQRTELSNTLNESYDKKELGTYSTSLQFSSIGYVPHVLGIFIGRGLNLSYTTTFSFGRYFSLLFYAFVVSFAIKKVCCGKVLMAFIGMFPTAIYMACSYSYDPWIIALSLVGFAYFFNMLKGEQIENSDIVKMLLCFLFGFFVKQVYFPALFMLLFIPKDKFKTKKQHNIYIILVFMVALVLAASIVLPIMFSSSGLGTGDARGGSGVNSTKQLQFILEDPMRYVRILLDFYKDYLSLFTAGEYMQNYAYLSYGFECPFMIISEVLLVVISVLDSGNKQRNKVLISTGIFGIFCSIILIASALYISYTPVGLDTINGCQSRYLIPLVFPVAYLFGFQIKKFHCNKNSLTNVTLLFSSISFIFWVGSIVCVLW